ncbi:MAG TPA: outer membrane beta-barrel protein [Mucilaginibacter sp.]|nr:outer membrane beta-barrel protein [Mucilaginibacter sp.]
MKIRHLLLALLLIISADVFAQTGRPVTGLVKDSTGMTIPGAAIKILMGKDSLQTATDANGNFNFGSVPVNQFSLVVFSVGYTPIKRRYTLTPGNTTAVLAPIVLKSDAIALRGVTITDVNAVKIKEDTIEYAAAAYKVREGAAVEDVIKKMPGMDVDANGNITAQGKSVSKVRLNGKDYMAGDVTSLTRNLPADLVQNIQVIDDYGDQANITGIKSGDPQKVLNINIRKDKNHGYFGQGTVGGGRNAIPQVDGTKDGDRYIASTNVFTFDGDRQIAVSGNLNNTNTSLFNFGGGGPGGRRGGGPPGLFGGNQNGITTARSFGFNYRDDWGKKMTVYGSYSFADNSVYTISKTFQDNLSGQLPSTQNSNSTENDQNINHRFNFNIEYRPDTINYFKFIPTFSYGGVHTNETAASTLAENTNGTLLSDYTLGLLSHSSAPNFGGSVLYNHRFAKRGRNFSVLVTGGTTTYNQYQNPVYNYLAGKANAPVNQQINTNSRTDSAGVSLSYLEPVGKISYLEFNYAYHNAHTTADKLTDTLTDLGAINRDPDLSNDYSFNFITNRFGVNYRVIDKKYNFTLGVAGQPSLLEGSSSITAPTNKTTFNFSPVARYVYNFSRSQTLTVNYQGASNSPTYNELQPVTDFSNATYPVEGNPNLLPEYNNTFSIRYNKFDFASGNVFFSNINFTQTDNKIVANTVTYPRNYAKDPAATDPKLAGAILTRYQNASGFYNASAFYLFAKPWEKRKYTLFINGNISYNNNISYLSTVDSTTFNESTQKNIAKNLVLTQGARFRVDITDIIDAEVNGSYSINYSNNSIPEANVNNNFRTITFGANGKHYIFKDWTLSYDYTKTIYEGYKGATNPNILNTYIERRFLKGNVGTLRFSVNDVFNQNTGFTSTQTAYSIAQSNVNRLGRYYLLTFTLRLQKFAGQRPRGPFGGPGGFRGPGPGGPSADAN